MSIEKEYGKFIPTCDNCGRTLDECDTFDDAVEAMAVKEWTRAKVDGEWTNKCPNCLED